MTIKKTNNKIIFKTTFILKKNVNPIIAIIADTNTVTNLSIKIAAADFPISILSLIKKGIENSPVLAGKNKEADHPRKKYLSKDLKLIRLIGLSNILIL